MPTKYPSPLLGYNNNVRHKGRVFHIQTEDSGARYGHIITHLFMDGGRILKSVKTSYSEYIGSERMSEIVREMMKQQHKAMFIALRDGKFDPIADGGAAAAAGSAPGIAAAPQQAPAASLGPVPPVASASTSALQPATPKPAAVAPPPPNLESDGTGKFGSQSIAAAVDEDAPPTLRQNSGSSSEIQLDVGAIERAAAAVPAEPILRDSSDLPPPPANLFRERGTGRYRSLTPAPTAAVEPHAPQSPAPEEAPAAAAPARGSSSYPPGKGERRYAPTRPASIFGQARPAQGKSIFGSDLISDKSLDEVILSYLAEDLDEKK
jgi:hypothetical protein